MKKASAPLWLLAAVVLTALIAQSTVPSSLQQFPTTGNTANVKQDWSVAQDAYARWLKTGTALPSEKEMISEYLRQGRMNSQRGNGLDNSGGPDAGGYFFVDDVDPDTATYDWIELRGMGGTNWINNFSSHDDGTADISLPFSFPFYGSDYNALTVITNGNLQFTTLDAEYTNECLPSTIIDAPMICLFWDDLHLDNGGIPSGTDVVGWRDFGSYVVIEWDSVGYFGETGYSVKMEVLLFDDGRIKMQYNLFGGGAPTNSATVGIQQGSGAYLEYLCDGTGYSVAAGRAIWFFPTPVCQDYVVEAPGLWSGNTCGAGNDCSLRSSEDQIFAVSIPLDGLQWVFTTCDANTDFDSYLYLMSECCAGSELASNDDNCALTDHSLNSTFVSGPLAAGTYYLVVEAWTGCGNYTLRISPACVPCQPGDHVEVTENVLTDTTFYYTDPDGGCNSQPPAFETINFGETVCGIGFNYLAQGNQYRDTDWYSFTVAVSETVTVSGWSEFPHQVALVSHSNCSNIQLLYNISSDELCTYEYANVWVPAGDYALFFAPNVYEGLNVLDELNYRVTLYHGVFAADEPGSELPSVFALHGSYPNPFNAETRIRLDLPRAADVKLAVYDVTGRLVSMLTQAHYEAGTHDIRFSAADLPSGIYFTRLDAAEFTDTKKMVLLK